MSIDIDWSLLDTAIEQRALDFLRSAFASVNRPSYLGPITVTDFHFGDASPEMKIVGIGDVFREFHQDDDDQFVGNDETNLSPQSPNSQHPPNEIPLQHPAEITSSPEMLESYLHSNPPPSSRPRYSVDYQHHIHHPHSRSPSPPLSRHNYHSPHDEEPNHNNTNHASELSTQSSNPPLSLQLHVHTAYTGNLTIGLETSLYADYPSSLFMSLPLSLRITGLALKCITIIGFVGEKRLVHVSIAEEEEQQDSLNSSDNNNSNNNNTLEPPTPSDPSLSRLPRPSPPPIKKRPGDSILADMVVRSQVGAEDKHVLKNVGKVEKFVLELARRTLENEIVYPNYQTIAF